jgi:hypothetical protein
MPGSGDVIFCKSMAAPLWPFFRRAVVIVESRIVTTVEATQDKLGANAKDFVVQFIFALDELDF